ncbi:MAG TPA: hypothetical protein VK513_14305 [Terriglobales bacterium]|nr:hypothetical protein [Terriglobales bacterium]
MKVKHHFEGTFWVWVLSVPWLMLPGPANAHNGPPFPIIENRRVGPCVISLWTHPDVGTGAFFVFVQPIPGGTVPKNLKVRIGVQPESGRLPEVVYEANQDDSGDQLQYKALVNFDRDEFWRVRLILEGSQGGGEAYSRVEATPTGFGKWDLLFFLLPFLLIALLWLRGMTRQRNRMKRLQAA